MKQVERRFDEWLAIVHPAPPDQIPIPTVVEPSGEYIRHGLRLLEKLLRSGDRIIFADACGETRQQERAAAPKERREGEPVGVRTKRFHNLVTLMLSGGGGGSRFCTGTTDGGGNSFPPQGLHQKVKIQGRLGCLLL